MVWSIYLLQIKLIKIAYISNVLLSRCACLLLGYRFHIKGEKFRHLRCTPRLYITYAKPTLRLNCGFRLSTNHRNKLHLSFTNLKFFEHLQRFDAGTTSTIWARARYWRLFYALYSRAFRGLWQVVFVLMIAISTEDPWQQSSLWSIFRTILSVQMSQPPYIQFLRNEGCQWLDF